MIAVGRGNITNLPVNFAGSRPATKLFAAKAIWPTALSTNLGSMPALPSVIARSGPPTFSIAVTKHRQRTSATDRQQRNPHSV
jgi:hypothetical protein